VRSYRTISPLPNVKSGGIFSVALSVKRASRLLPRPLAGILPCGDRTFLPREAGDRLLGRLRCYYTRFRDTTRLYLRPFKRLYDSREILRAGGGYAIGLPS
jgi:hypothetical protein